MSIKLDDVVITPSVVNAGNTFVISVSVWNEEFEFGESPSEKDIHQGFADDAQTIGGKFIVIEAKDFEFGEFPEEEDLHRGFADDAQTIGGKLI